MSVIQSMYKAWNTAIGVDPWAFPVPMRWRVGRACWAAVKRELGPNDYLPMKEFGEFNATILGRPVVWDESIDGFVLEAS